MRRDRLGGATSPSHRADCSWAWHRREARRLDGEPACLGGRLASQSAGRDPARRFIDCGSSSPPHTKLRPTGTNLERAASLAIAAGSRDVETLVRRGWAQIHLGRPAEAAADFRQALEREPGSAAFRLGLFLTTAELGELRPMPTRNGGR